MIVECLHIADVYHCSMVPCSDYDELYCFKAKLDKGVVFVLFHCIVVYGCQSWPKKNSMVDKKALKRRMYWWPLMSLKFLVSTWYSLQIPLVSEWKICYNQQLVPEWALCMGNAPMDGYYCEVKSRLVTSIGRKVTWNKKIVQPCPATANHNRAKINLGNPHANGAFKGTTYLFICTFGWDIVRVNTSPPIHFKGPHSRAHFKFNIHWSQSKYVQQNYMGVVYRYCLTSIQRHICIHVTAN